MNNLKSAFALILVVFTTSCSFTETMTFSKDGSGRLSLQLDFSEAMAFSGDEIANDASENIDTTFAFRDILIEKKDSIAQLPFAEQERLKKLEAYQIHILMNNETKKFIYDIFIDFNDVSQASNLSDVLNNINGTATEEGGGMKTESVKVNYSYKNNVFKRDAYITDKELHQRELDSLSGMEMFLGGMTYGINYSFESNIKSCNIDEATISEDRKSLTYEVGYLDYFKNPDILDMEIVLE